MVILTLEAIEGEVRSEPLNRNFSKLDSKAHEANQNADTVKQDLTDFESVMDGNLKKIYDFSFFPQSPLPPKTGMESKSFKIIHKRTADTLYVTQKTNKGYVQYRLERNAGANNPERDYGVNHELIRLVRARHMAQAYVYYDVSNPFLGTVETNTAPSGFNSIEEYIFPSTNIDVAKNHNSGKDGIGSYRFSSGSDVTYRIDSKVNEKINILFLCTPGSTNKLDVFINDQLVETFDPREYTPTAGGETSALRLLELDVPFNIKVNRLNIRLENNGSSGWAYICAINFFKLEDYQGQHINQYKAFGSAKEGWIEIAGASDYAIRDSQGKLFGSYHGGETSLSNQIYFNPISNYPVNEYDYINIPFDDVSGWSVQKEFNIYQRTSLANDNADMISRFNFDIDGTMLMDFAYYSQNNFPISSFRTALTSTSEKFKHLTYPIYKIFPENPTEEYFEFPITEGRVTQVSSSERLQLDIRFTRFNKEFSDKAAYIADSSAYRKFYYGPLDGAVEVPLKSLTFSKGLDFIVR